MALTERIVRKSGEVRTLRSWGEVISEEDGRAARMIDICQDVTEQVAASEGLARSLSLLQATLETTADGLLALHRNGKVQSLNQKFLQRWRIPGSLAQSRKGDR